MSGTTNAQLASQVSALVSSWRTREAQYRAWLGGSATGGANGDGRYPLTDATGATYMVESPARLADMVSGPAALALSAKEAAAAVEAYVRSEAQRLAALAAGVEANRRAALDARDQAQLARELAQGIEARVLSYRDAALSAHEGTQGDLQEVRDLHDDTVYQAALAADAAFDAAAAADRAATFDPAQYAPVSHQHTWAQIAGKPSEFTPTAHSHAEYAALTGARFTGTTIIGRNATTGETAFGGSNIEMRWASGPYIDFSKDSAADFHARIQLNVNDSFLDVSSGGLRVNGASVLTTTSLGDLVTVSGTNLGRTGNGGLETGTKDAAWWGGLPTGFSKMTNLTTANGTPVSGFGYFFKMARRDNSNGWSGLWTNHGGSYRRLFVGFANDQNVMPSWNEVWTDGNFDPNAKANLAGGNAFTGVSKFKNSGEPGLQIMQEDEQTAMRFGPAGGISFKTNGVWQSPHGNIKDLMFCRIDQWNNSTDGYPRFLFAGQSRTYIRGYDGIEFRNAADVTTLFVREDGNLIGTGEVFAGIDRWFRVRGNTGIYWENHGGGWFMRDSTWMRSHNDKHVFTGGRMRADQGFYVGDLRQPVIRSGTAAPSGGSDGDLYVQF